MRSLLGQLPKKAVGTQENGGQYGVVEGKGGVGQALQAQGQPLVAEESLVDHLLVGKEEAGFAVLHGAVEQNGAQAGVEEGGDASFGGGQGIGREGGEGLRGVAGDARAQQIGGLGGTGEVEAQDGAGIEAEASAQGIFARRRAVGMQDERAEVDGDAEERGAVGPIAVPGRGAHLGQAVEEQLDLGRLGRDGEVGPVEDFGVAHLSS